MVDAVVIERDRHSARGDVDGHTLADDERAGVVHFEAPTTVKFHRENPKRLQLPQPFKNSIEILRCHDSLSGCFQSPEGLRLYLLPRYNIIRVGIVVSNAPLQFSTLRVD